jgi:DNA polymerase-3 subunit epsilon
MASILESVEIKKYWPRFNYSQKHWEDVFGVIHIEDRNGFLRLIIEKTKRILNQFIVFTIYQKAIVGLRNCY